MKDYRWETSEEVTEREDGEAAQLASAQQIHFVGPQISQCYVSWNPRLVFAEKQQQALAVLEHDQSGLQVNTPHWRGPGKHFAFNSLRSSCLAYLMDACVRSIKYSTVNHLQLSS